MKVPPLLLSLVLLLTTATTTLAYDHPIFTTAQVGVTGSWTGYRADIQVRPLTYAVWPGGYLSDGTFVQNGFINNYGEGLYVFAWATHNTASADYGKVPLVTKKVKPLPNSWVTFELAQSNNRWTFRYHDATGWHKQGSFYSRARLSVVSFVNEYWAGSAQPFLTQVMKNVKVRANGVWKVPENVAYSSNDEQCGHEDIRSSSKGRLLFQSVDEMCSGYYRYHRLW